MLLAAAKAEAAAERVDMSLVGGGVEAETVESGGEVRAMPCRQHRCC